jgi:hypothetical protein
LLLYFVLLLYFYLKTRHLMTAVSSRSCEERVNSRRHSFNDLPWSPCINRVSVGGSWASWSPVLFSFSLLFFPWLGNILKEIWSFCPFHLQYCYLGFVVCYLKIYYCFFLNQCIKIINIYIYIYIIFFK